MRRLLPLALLLAGTAPAAAGAFAVYPVGEPRDIFWPGMQGVGVAVEYFQPIDLDGAMMHPSDNADIHLEADITALKDDPDGYAEGDWRPYLIVTYRLAKQGSTWTSAGTLMPLVSYGGGGGGKPHYGDNLALAGPGRYRLELNVAPPAGGTTGLGAGLQPFTFAADFIYAGTGKRGAY